jgi:hypothetical protein
MNFFIQIKVFCLICFALLSLILPVHSQAIQVAPSTQSIRCLQLLKTLSPKSKTRLARYIHRFRSSRLKKVDIKFEAELQPWESHVKLEHPLGFHVYLGRNTETQQLLVLKSYTTYKTPTRDTASDIYYEQIATIFWQQKGIKVPSVLFVNNNRVYKEYVEGITITEIKNLPDDDPFFEILGKTKQQLLHEYDTFERHAIQTYERYFEAWVLENHSRYDIDTSNIDINFICKSRHDIGEHNALIDTNGDFVLFDP